MIKDKNFPVQKVDIESFQQNIQKISPNCNISNFYLEFPRNPDICFQTIPNLAKTIPLNLWISFCLWGNDWLHLEINSNYQGHEFQRVFFF